mmetsp:Transcript_5752/g.22702  ORF Transcript_5752/g.22702 Transcript_5752/m.22702 type:complete len:220 (+) Transcript_5752:4089-4748(+)
MTQATPSALKTRPPIALWPPSCDHSQRSEPNPKPPAPRQSPVPFQRVLLLIRARAVSRSQLLLLDTTFLRENQSRLRSTRCERQNEQRAFAQASSNSARPRRLRQLERPLPALNSLRSSPKGSTFVRSMPKLPVKRSANRFWTLFGTSRLLWTSNSPPNAGRKAGRVRLCHHTREQRQTLRDPTRRNLLNRLKWRTLLSLRATRLELRVVGHDILVAHD